MQVKRRAILVVGAPRSGTSIAAQVVSRLGVDFGNPDRFVDPQLNRHNPIFFELESLNQINDAIFGYFFKEWSNFDWLPQKSDFSESVCNLFRNSILQFIAQEFQDAPIIGLKDPRFCFTLPLWESVLSESGFEVQYILVRRTAQDIFRSNYSINRQSSHLNFRLVVHSYLYASEFTKSRPCAILQYEDLLSDPTATIQKICDTLSLSPTYIEDAIKSIEKGLQHHHEKSKLSDYRYFPEIIDKRLNADIDSQLYKEVYRSVPLDSEKENNNFSFQNSIKAAYIENLSHAPTTLLRIFNALWMRLDIQSIHTLIRLTHAFIRLTQTLLARLKQDYRVFDAVPVLSQDGLAKNPLISIIMPVYNPKVEFLNEAIKSVQKQIYPNWELCIADDKSSDPAVRELIKKYADEDSRIRYAFRSENGHISAASNSALALANGEYFALLDHDDLLHPLALQYVAREINLRPEAELFYSDEDKLDETGNRKDPYFKPDFNYDLFLSQNMISHLGVYKTETVRKIGGFRIGLEGSQDYDLALRMLAEIGADKIIHIPHILYHWRISTESAASGSDAKPYAFTAGLRAIKLYLLQKGISASVNFFPQASSYQVVYALPRPRPSVAFILMPEKFNQRVIHHIQTLLESASGYPSKIYLFWNSSKHGEIPSRLRDIPELKIIEQRDSTHPIEALNQEIKSLNEEYICFLSADFESFSENWLDVLIGRASQSDAGAISPLLLRRDQRLYSSGVIVQKDGTLVKLFSGVNRDQIHYYGWSHLARGFSVISDKCFLIKRELFFESGGFSNIFSSHPYLVADLCMRLRKMEKHNAVIPYASVQLGASSVQYWKIKSWKDKKSFHRRWKDRLAHYDPAFNPNLEIKFGKIRFITQRRKLGL